MDNRPGLVLKDNPKLLEFRDILNRYKDRFVKLIPQHMSPDKMLLLGLNAMGRNPQLLQCTPQSVLRALIIAAQLGLDPTGALGHGWILPYGKVATFIPGYRGLIDLARRSGEVSSVEAHIVYTGDRFNMNYGLPQSLTHHPTTVGERGEPMGAYAIIHFTKQGVPALMEWMTRADIEGVRKRSRAKDSGPWISDWEAMARKTVLKRALRYAPMSTEVSRAVAIEDRFEETGNQDDIGDIVPMPDLEDAPASKSKGDELADRLRDTVTHTTGATGAPTGIPEGAGPAPPRDENQTDMFEDDETPQSTRR